MTSVPAISFEYRCWRPVTVLGVCLVVLAVTGIGLSAASPSLAIALSALTISLACRELAHWRASSGWLVLWDTQGAWTLRRGSAVDVAARLSSHRVLGEWVVLRLELADGRTMALVLTSGNTDHDQLRRLRIRLAASRDDAERTPGAVLT